MDCLITTPEGVRDTLERYGVAVIPSVLSADESKGLVDGLWDYFEHITAGWGRPIDRNNADTYVAIHKLLPLHGMLFQAFGIGHAQALWDVRQNPKVLDIFSHIWRCPPEDLLVSFDGASFGLPPEITGRGWHRSPWLHTDQSPLRNGFECIQAWATGLDVRPGDGTLMALPGSHKLHAAYAAEYKLTDEKKYKKDWLRIDDEHLDFYTSRGCLPIEITCPIGSLVLWDSRTIHCGKEPIRARPAPNIRAVVYLSYMPRASATKKNLGKKQLAFINRRTTSHWANRATLFAKTPRTYGAPLPAVAAVPEPILTAIGMRLAGL